MADFPPRATWTIFSSANDGLPENYRKEAFALGHMIGAMRHDYCYGGHLGGLMGEVHQGVDAARKTQPGDAAEKSHIISVPYHIYYQPCNDHYFQQVHVKHDLREQQLHLYSQATQLVALPGGIGTRGEIWNTLEELRCNKAFTDKFLWIMNVDKSYEGFLEDVHIMLENGTAKQADFARMKVVRNTGELRERYHETLKPEL